MSARLIVGVDPGRYGHGVVARTAEDAEVVRERVDNDAAAIDELITRVVGLAGGGGQALWVIEADGGDGAVQQQPCLDRRPKGVGEILRRLGESRADCPKIAETEAPAQDRRVGQDLAGRCRQPRCPALDESTNRRRHEPGGVPAEFPTPIDELQRAGLAVRAGELLDDERDALGLDLVGVGNPDSCSVPPGRIG